MTKSKKWSTKLSADHLIHRLSQHVKTWPDQTTKTPNKISLHDCVLSGLAVFSLKFPSLLTFDQQRLTPHHQQNLKNLFHVNHIPCDTTMRERLDSVDSRQFQPLFRELLNLAQRQKVLEDFVFMDGQYLLACDGTQHFSSKKIHCDQCLQKKHQNGSVTYSHQMVMASLVHPTNRLVIPICPEPITRRDGTKKNDCERNASKRLLQRLKKDHPRLKLTIIEDSLASNAPHIELIEQLRYDYILGVKPDDHQWLFHQFETHHRINTLQIIDPNGTQHYFEFVNDLELNRSSNVITNLLVYREIPMNKNKPSRRFSWVTNKRITIDNVQMIMEGGRARWKIENETINTLKNNDYQFEHNYGHGHQHLATNLALLMVLAFLVDQLQLLGCPAMKQARIKSISYRNLWESLRRKFNEYVVRNWADIWLSIGLAHAHPTLIIDTC